MIRKEKERGTKFALSAKQGVIFFIETGFLKRDAKGIALFLYRNKDKLQNGELLGREPDASFVKDTNWGITGEGTRS